MFFNKIGVVVAENTFIGGTGLTESTAALLETRLGLLPGDVTLFSIDGSNNISCRIEVDYVLGASYYQNRTDITYYNDNDGHVTYVALNCFNSCSNLASIILPNSSRIELRSFYNCSVLTSVTAPKTLTIASAGLYLSDVVNYDFPILTSLTQNRAFRNNAFVETIYMPLCTSIGSDPSINDLNFEAIKTGCVITVAASMETANAGSPDADLVYAVGTRGATIVYV